MKLIDRLVSLWQQEQPLEVLPKPGLDRRAFLKILGSSAAIAAAVPMLDLEALIWTPKPIILAPDVAELGLAFLTPDWVVKEALRVLERNLAFTKIVDSNYHNVLHGGFSLPMGTEMRIKDARSDVIQPIANFMIGASDLERTDGRTARGSVNTGRVVARATNREGLTVRAANDTINGYRALRIDVTRESSI